MHIPGPWSPLNGGRILDAQLGKVVCDPKRDKVVIVAASTYSAHYAPLDDPAWEVWTLNTICPQDSLGRVRMDRHFELHPLEVQSSADLLWLKACPVPLYMFEAYPGFPSAVRFPIEQIERRFLHRRGLPGDFFACSFAYQLALALMEGYQAIGLAGVDLDKGTARERTVERACVAWWLGVAQGMGVKISLPENSHLLVHPFRYGYEYAEEKAWTEAWLEQVAVEGVPWEETSCAQ